MDKFSFNKIRNIVYDTSGIFLSDDKEALVAARINKRIRKLKLADYKEYTQYLLQDDDSEEIQELLDVISTNVTSFYRESDHFDYLREIVRAWFHNNVPKIRIWSSACSSGEEPYTIAIEIIEALRNSRVNLKILATDINSDVLRKAQKGEYTEDKMSPVPKNIKIKYFTELVKKGKRVYKIKDEIKNKVIFRQFNLSTFPYPLKGNLDAIFCRNVMIYFDKKLRNALIYEFERLLKPGGVLFVGHSESITGTTTKLRRIKPSIYLKE